MGGQRQRIPKDIREKDKLNFEQIQLNASKFLSLKSSNELCKLLNINTNQLLEVFNATYETISVFKKGKHRVVYKPSPELILIQRELLKYLSSVYTCLRNDNKTPSFAYINGCISKLRFGV
jgi:hypothetical protein